MNALLRDSGRRSWQTLVFFALCIAPGCGGDGQSPAVGKSVLAAQPAQPAQQVQQSGPVVTKGLPTRDTPIPLAATSEAAQIDEVLKRLMQDKGTLRVIIRLEDSTLARVEAPKYDPRLKRSSIRPKVPDKDSLGRIASAQSTLLERFPPGKDRRVHRFDDAPYVALDVNEEDVRALQRWIVEEKAGSQARPYKVWVEANRVLTQQCAPAVQLEATVEEAVTFMQFEGITPVSATPSTVIIIDDLIDDKLHLLHGRIDEMHSIDYQGNATPIPLSPTPYDPADYDQYSLSHGTKLALIVSKAAPNARIIALDVFGGSKTTDPELLRNALDFIYDTWTENTTRKIAAVCVSIGDKTLTSSGSCNCESTSMYVGCNSINQAIIEKINGLAQYQIPVVISAGSVPGYLGEVLFPACVSTGVTVGGTHGGMHGQPLVRSDASNWGPMVDLCAQSSELTIQLDQWMSPPPATPHTFNFTSGSSYAVPFVAAAYSVLLDSHGDWSNDMLFLSLKESPVLVTDYGGTAVPEIRVAVSSKWLDDHPPIDPAPTPPEPEPAPTPAPDPTQPTPPPGPGPH